MNRLCDKQFRIVGSCVGGKRVLVDAINANAAYASCNPVCKLDEESYLSCFWYGNDMDQYINQHKSTKGFDGMVWSPYLYFDIDREGDLEAAHRDALQLVNWLFDNGTTTDVWFTGSKGFSIATPVPSEIPPSLLFNKVCQNVAEAIAAKAKIGAIDTCVYVKVQPLRAPNSTHAKTGLHKRWVSRDELNMSLADIKELAKNPVIFSWELPTKVDVGPLRRLWVEGIKMANEAIVTSPIKSQADSPNVERQRTALNRGTIDFISNGAESGDRHRLLYSAARNLAEFKCPSALAHALLSPAACDCGLPYNDVKRQIECGLKDGGVYE